MLNVQFLLSRRDTFWGFMKGGEQAMSIERERTVGREQLEKLSMIVML